MTAYEFESKFKKGDVLSIGTYYILLDCIRPGRLRRDSNAIVYYAIEDIFGDFDVHAMPAPGIGYIEGYKDDEVRLVTNRKKREFYDRLARRGYKWDSEHNMLVPTMTE